MRLTSRRKAVCAVLAGVLLLSAAGDVFAQMSSRSDPLRFVEYLRNDFVALGPGLVSASPIVVAGVSSAVMATSRYDARLQDQAEQFRDEEVIRFVNEFGDVRTVRPFTFLVFAGSLMQSDERFQDAAFTSFEAVVLSNLATGTLKAVFGRARPFQGQGADVFDPFSGNTSFPSGHATTVFAFITPWVVYYPGPVTFAAAGLAAGTATARLSLRFHWPSDVVAGAAIGSMTGIWLSRRHLGRTGRTRVQPVTGPGTLGLRVIW